MRATERSLQNDRRRLARLVDEIGKPSAIARELGVDVSTIAYWIRSVGDG